jgi:integrase
MPIVIRPYKRGGFEVDIVVLLPNSERIRERRRSPVSTRSGTQRWAEARERELLLRGMKPAPKKAAPLLSEFEPTYLDLGRANRQKESTHILKKSLFKKWLIPHLGHKRLDAITTADVENLKKALSNHGRKHTNNVLTTLAACLRAAVRLKLIDALPCEITILKIPKKAKPFWDFEDFERLVQCAAEIDSRTHLLVLLGAEAGLRVGEIVALEQADVDYKRGFLTVRRTEYRGHVDVPKGGNERRVPMTTRLAAALKAHRHLRGDRVLYCDDGSTVTEKILWGWLGKAIKRAALGKGHPHMLRHTFCSHLAAKGAPARAIQDLAGHADLNTTLLYMHLSPTATNSAIRLLEVRGDILETSTLDSTTTRN